MKMGYNSVAIHGDMEQKERESSLSTFKRPGDDERS